MGPNNTLASQVKKEFFYIVRYLEHYIKNGLFFNILHSIQCSKKVNGDLKTYFLCPIESAEPRRMKFCK